MVKLRDILGRGYFPREVPPPFNTQQFAVAVTDSAGALRSEIGAAVPDYAELCIHNMVRSGGLRRHLGIPNPVPFALLCQFVASHWSKLEAACGISPYSQTRPVVTSDARAISGSCALGERVAKRVALRANAKSVLRCDVSRFYPSIYTHSLPWSIEGKEHVKEQWANRKMAAVWSDEFDRLTRNLNDKQTVGIPIGPDTSLLTAECVLSAVDQELALKHPRIEGIRFIDDYEFAIREPGEAERVVSDLQAILSRYELALNPSKTKVIRLPDTLEELWVSQLRVFVFREAGSRGQLNDLTAYFDRAFLFSAGDRHANVMQFAVARLNSVRVHKENWKTFQRLLCQGVSVEPACLPQVCEQLVHYRSLDYEIDTHLWTQVLNQVVVDHLPLGQASEALWSMWIMKACGLRLDLKGAQAVDTCEDDLVALMGLGLANVGLADSEWFSRLHTLAESTELQGRHWLLCYEGNKQGWLKPPSGTAPFQANLVFLFLADNGVSFFDISAGASKPRRRDDLGGGAVSGSGDLSG